MSGLLDVLRAAAGPAAAARVGVLQGQHQREEEERRDRLQDIALKRQSYLDQIRADAERARAARDRAQGQYYEKRQNTPPAPHTLDTEELGYMQWDPESKTYKPTGLHSAASARATATATRADQRETRADAREKREVAAGARAEAASGRADARANRQDTKDALAGVEKQIGDTRSDLAEQQNPMTHIEPDTTRIKTIRQRLDSLVRVSDWLNAEMKKPVGPHRTPPKVKVNSASLAQRYPYLYKKP